MYIHMKFVYIHTHTSVSRCRHIFRTVKCQIRGMTYEVSMSLTPRERFSNICADRRPGYVKRLEICSHRHLCWHCTPLMSRTIAN